MHLRQAMDNGIVFIDLDGHPNGSALFIHVKAAVENAAGFTSDNLIILRPDKQLSDMLESMMNVYEESGAVIIRYNSQYN